MIPVVEVAEAASVAAVAVAAAVVVALLFTSMSLLRCIFIQRFTCYEFIVHSN